MVAAVSPKAVATVSMKAEESASARAVAMATQKGEDTAGGTATQKGEDTVMRSVGGRAMARVAEMESVA